MSLQSRIKGYTGEVKTRLAQTFFLDIGVYHAFYNIIIPGAVGTTQIDHIIVSKYGIFVIETKNHTGWIYGDEKQKQWTKVYPNKTKFRFPNPLHQNYGHVRNLATALGVPPEKIFSVVCFWGDCKLKTDLPDNVVKGNPSGYIKSKKQVIFTDEAVAELKAKIKEIEKNTPLFAGLRHTRELKERLASTTKCPKCGGNLIERTARTGANAGSTFLGCERYPTCRYTKQIT